MINGIFAPSVSINDLDTTDSELLRGQGERRHVENERGLIPDILNTTGSDLRQAGEDTKQTVFTTTDASGNSIVTTSYSSYTITSSSSPSPTGNDSHSSNRAAVIGGVVTGVLLFLAVVILSIICMVRRRKRNARQHNSLDPYPFSGVNAAISQDDHNRPFSYGSTSFSTDMPGSGYHTDSDRTLSFMSKLFVRVEQQRTVSPHDPDAFLSASRRSSASVGRTFSRWSSNSDTSTLQTVQESSEKEGEKEAGRWSASSDAFSFHTAPDLDEKGAARESFSSLFSPLDPCPSSSILHDPFSDFGTGSSSHKDTPFVA
ncbi:hypothetical protein V5O48_011304 [Marasmius crinis-equi]|uniref:Mid2 domain-containing protein n=1 Tax=Marasmius crinis-equi TaxID=585013 RepID=A0ABR3F5Z2_9AGAR